MIYIYAYIWLTKKVVNVGKYTSLMDPMGNSRFAAKSQTLKG